MKEVRVQIKLVLGAQGWVAHLHEWRSTPEPRLSQALRQVATAVEPFDALYEALREGRLRQTLVDEGVVPALYDEDQEEEWCAFEPEVVDRLSALIDLGALEEPAPGELVMVDFSDGRIVDRGWREAGLRA